MHLICQTVKFTHLSDQFLESLNRVIYVKVTYFGDQFLESLSQTTIP